MVQRQARHFPRPVFLADRPGTPEHPAAAEHPAARPEKRLKTKGSLYLRAGAGKNKPDLVIMPDNTTVRNYGYYTLVDGVKWLYVQAVVKGVTYTGFCSSNTNYLKKL